MTQAEYELNEWLLNEGERIELKAIGNGDQSLSPWECLVREVWVLDMESLNGGVSQYFCNHGWERWEKLQRAAAAYPLASLRPVLSEIGRVVAGAEDPMAALEAPPGLEDFYHERRGQVLAELRDAALGA